MLVPFVNVDGVLRCERKALRTEVKKEDGATMRKMEDAESQRWGTDDVVALLAWIARLPVAGWLVPGCVPGCVPGQWLTSGCA